MFERAARFRVIPAALIVGLATLLAACGGGEQIDFDAVDSGGGVTPTATLDQQLALLLADANAETVAPGPQEPTAMIELGKALFYDKILSGNQNISCATCHHPSAATGDALPVSIGEGGSGLAENRQQEAGHLIPRNAPHVFNIGASGFDVMFWDGRVRIDAGTGVLTTPEPGLNGPSPALATYVDQLTTALAAQAMFPVTSFEEMRGQPGSNAIADAATNQQVWELLMARLVGTSNGTVGGIAEYRTMFQAAYPTVVNFDEFTFAHAARALAAFERDQWTMLASPYDQYLAGDTSALSNQEKRGAALFFGQAQCANCHNGAHLTDLQFHSICAPQVGPGKIEVSEDRGLALQTSDINDNYKFRTPPLRNIALTAPYTHAGAFMTLEGVVRHHLDAATSLNTYDATQLPALFEPTYDNNPGRQAARINSADPLMPVLSLSDAQVADLVAFLHALTDPASTLLEAAPDSVPSGLPVAD